MIKNERQYKITKSNIDNFKNTLSYMNNDEKPSPLLQLEKNAIKSQIVDLEKEMNEYNNLKSSAAPIDLTIIEELPIALIKARISLGYSQKELGKLIGVHEQQIQRYESTDYETATITKIKKIARIFNMEIEKIMPFSDQKLLKKTFFSKLKELGIDSKFVKKYLIPSHISASLDNPNGSPELPIIKATTYINKIFKIEPNKIFSSKSLILNDVLLSNVKFKVPKNINRPKLNTHVIYAKYISNLVSQSTKQQLINKKLLDDPYEVHDMILEKYQKINFGTLLQFVWDWGIPVVSLDVTTFHGACFNNNDGKVIILAQKTPYEARWMFNLLHELYHATQENKQNFVEHDNFYGDDEILANKYAAIVLLGQDPGDLADMCWNKSNYKLELLKKTVRSVSKEKNVRADVLANYIAYRLHSEQNVTWWGTAASFQHTLDKASFLIQDHLLKNINFNALNDVDVNLLKQIFDSEEIVNV